MTVFTLVLVATVVFLAAILTWDRLDRRARRRDRQTARRLHTYMAQLPPARSR